MIYGNDVSDDTIKMINGLMGPLGAEMDYGLLMAAAGVFTELAQGKRFITKDGVTDPTYDAMREELLPKFKLAAARMKSLAMHARGDPPKDIADLSSETQRAKTWEAEERRRRGL